MTSQEKKEWLKKYRNAERDADQIEQEIMRWRSKSERMTTALKLIPGGGGGGRSIEEAQEAIDDLAAELGNKRCAAVQLRKTIGAAIEDIEDTKLRQVLRLKYIDGMTWERLAEEMDITPRGATKMHGRALRKIVVSSL